MDEQSGGRFKVFGASFEEAFPELEDAVVEWEGLGEGGPPMLGGKKWMSYKAGCLQGIIRCSNPSCQGGGFEVGLAISRAVQEGRAERAGVLVCSGWEGEEQPCTRSITYRIQVAYKRGSGGGVNSVPPAR